MVEKQENSSAGFDPLAWMNQEEGESPEIEVLTKEIEPKTEPEPEPVVEKNIATDQPDSAHDEVSQDIENKSDGKIILDKRVNIQGAAELYEQLLAMIESQEKIEIDASAVESIDTASLQLLTVFKRTAVEGYKEVLIDFPSDVFIDAAKALDLSDILGIEQSAAGLF